MRPAMERRALKAIDDAKADLTEARKALIEALARDDMPSSGREHDPVHSRTRTACLDAVAIGEACSRFKGVSRAAAQQAKLDYSRSECGVCGSDKRPNKRGMCPMHYQQWVRAGRPDAVAFIAMCKTEEAQ